MKFSLSFVLAACATANCTNGDRHSLAAMDVNDLGKIANDCGSEAYGMLTGVFEKDKFNSCFMKKVSISESCSDCYATSGEYGAKNCKAACLLGWCKQGCLDCTAPATKKVSECVGDEVHFKQVAPCLEAVLFEQGHPLVNPESGKCLDIYNPDGLAPSQFEDETPVNIFRCNGGKGQQWLLQDGQLVNPASGKCLDIYNPSELSPEQLQDETKVQLLHCKGNPNQQWALLDQGIGHKHLVNIPSGKCLDVYSPSGNLDDDTQVQLFTCDGDKGNQKWRFDFLVASGQLDLFPTQRWSHHSDSTLSTDGQLCLDWTSKDGHSVYVSSCDPEHLPHHKWALSSDGKLSTDEAGSLVLDWTSRVGSDGYHAVYMSEAGASLPHQHWRLSTDGALTAEGGAGLCLGWLPGGAVRMMPCQGVTSSNDATENILAATAHGKCEDDCMAQRGYDYPTCRSMCLGAADTAHPLEGHEHDDLWRGHDHHDHHDNWHHHDHHDTWWHGGNDHHHHDLHDWRHDHAVTAEVMV